MYLKIKLIEYNITVYCKILSESKNYWTINKQPKLNLDNNNKHPTKGKCRHEELTFKLNKLKDHSLSGYIIKGHINDLDLTEIDQLYIYE